MRRRGSRRLFPAFGVPRAVFAQPFSLFAPFALVAPAALVLAGCSLQSSPALPLFGAYFPSWLICLALGVVGAVLVRAIFIPLGLDDMLPARLLVYTSLAAAIGFLAALTIYGR